MEPQFWLDRWKQREIGFHREEAHAALRRFWPRLNLTPGTKVFVPLCGMSPDMAWLAAAGHKVIGAELSEIAIVEFFQTRNLTPEIRKTADHTIYSKGPFELWAGDLFKLPPEAIAGCTAVYDRASLVALPDAMQKNYAAILKQNLPPHAQMLLISLTYDPAEMDGPPFSTPLERIQTLFEPAFKIEVLENAMTLDENDNLKQRGLSALTETTVILQDAR